MYKSTGNDNSHILILYTRTWPRDSHGLYDYESTQTKNIKILIANTVKLLRVKNDIKQVANNYTLQQEEKELLSVEKIATKYYLSNNLKFNMEASEQNITDLQDKLWYIIKCEDQNQGNTQNLNTNNTNEFYSIRLNDIIKLGRVKYAVTEVNISGISTSSYYGNQSRVFDLIYNAVGPSQGYEDDTMCKICLSNHHEDSNPFITLCKCNGSMQYIHYDCLKKWMACKLQIKNNEKKNVTSYNMKAFNCEICKTPYPLKFKYQGIHFDLINIEKPSDKKYIVLESLNQLKDNNNFKSIHVVVFDTEDKIILGRGHDSDVRINDISVSRVHASILLSNDQIILKDLKSKFGTLALLKDDVEVKDKKICLQIGRTYAEAGLMTYSEYQKLKQKVEKVNEEKNKEKDSKQASKTQLQQVVRKESKTSNPTPGEAAANPLRESLLDRLNLNNRNSGGGEDEDEF